MTETAFVNSFWGPGDGGFAVVQQRLRSADATLAELLHFYKERITIEKEYTRRLERLGSTVLGGSETGSLKTALERLSRENLRSAADNKTFVASVAHHNYDKLAAFAGEYRRSTAKLESHMAKVLGRKNDHWAQLEAAKAKYRAECSQVKSLTLSCQTTWGRELEKNEARRRRAVRALGPSRVRYQEAVAQYAAVHEAWVRDWAAALASLYSLEIERIQMCKLNCFSFCNHVASLCVAWDSAADAARSTIADVAAPRDVAAFARAYGTGAAIDGVPEFVDFLEGKDDAPVPAATAHFDDPDYAAVLSRTFSLQSGLVPAPVSPARDKALPAVRESPAPSPTALDPARKSPSFSTFNSDDVFDKRDGSDYSSPTNYTVRSWASPRKNTTAAVQDNINRRSRDMTAAMPPAPAPAPAPEVPIAKDFSIDFIAKALEDLDAGGNGDVSHLRRSVRARANGTADGTADGDGDVRPASDFVDDSREVATRFDSISFKSPAPRERTSLPQADSARTVRHRSLSKSPTKSYTNLRQLVAPPQYVTKARAKYSYTAREDGELSFRKGWHMYVIQKQEDNWYVCELADNCGALAGTVGLVPYNYVVEGPTVF